MTEENIVRTSLREARKKRERGETQTSKDAPEFDLPANFWDKAEVVVPDNRKVPLKLRLDPDMVEWFRSKGRGYQTRMNAVLRSYYEAHRKDSA